MELKHTLELDGQVWIMCLKHGRFELEADRQAEIDGLVTVAVS